MILVPPKLPPPAKLEPAAPPAPDPSPEGDELPQPMRQSPEANQALLQVIRVDVIRNLVSCVSNRRSHRWNAANASGARNGIAAVRIDGADLSVLRTDGRGRVG